MGIAVLKGKKAKLCSCKMCDKRSDLPQSIETMTLHLSKLELSLLWCSYSVRTPKLCQHVSKRLGAPSNESAPPGPFFAKIEKQLS